MKTAFFFFLLGAVAGGYAIHSYDLREPRRSDFTASNFAAAAREDVAEKIRQWHLTPDEIRGDLARTGEVVRTNAEIAGDRITDARIVTVIKSKYVLDRDLSARDIAVDVSDGHVSLAGTVASDDLIGKAVMLALDTSGVKSVAAKLAVAPGP
jgi:osmotically-inducible protein OsmY